ncbi:MAG: hypothetical protein J0L73_01405 [Verrucomicrobia bacterium]|nr:hypothetical protein [Verrucomicrobiota bacterium]
MLVSPAWSLPAETGNIQEHGNFENWVESGAEEVSRLACPIPQLLFSLPATEFRTDSFHFSWLTDAELAPFQEGLNPDSRLIDLTNQMMVCSPVFWELVTTDGLIMDLSARPKDPIPPCHIIRSIRLSDETPWESFWLKSLPVPSALRSMSFTRELVLEDPQLSRSAARRLCRAYRIRSSITL